MKIRYMPEKFHSTVSGLNRNICLLGLQGSRALGMQMTNDADYDYRGIYIAKNRELFGLFPGKETIGQVDSRDDCLDLVLHEVGKFFRLALKGNPSVFDILFLPRYEIRTDIGDMIVRNKEIFLGTKTIAAAYGGYAMSQILYLNRNHKFTEGKSTAEKISKHVRHCFRLFDQGQELLETGKITFPLNDPKKYIDIGNISDYKLLRKMFEERNEEFINCKSVLPELPDVYMANELLLKIRGIYD